MQTKRVNMSEAEKQAENVADRERKKNFMQTKRKDRSEEEKRADNEAKKKRMHEMRIRRQNQTSEEARRDKFKERTRFGQSFPCITCHQTLFRNQVLEYDEKISENLEKVCPEPILEVALESLEAFRMKIEEHLDENNGNRQITLTSGGDTAFLCRVCHSHLKKGKLPPKAVANYLEAVPVPEELKMRSYLEEALIARVLLFQKIFSLKSSLMPAMKDRCVVIPLERQEIQDTVESLPRLPKEGQIIDIQWKRRMGQKNAHLQAKVDPQKIQDALKFLQGLGNPHYTEVEDMEQYKERCRQEDPEGFKIIFGEEDPDTLTLKFVDDASVEPMWELPKYLELREVQDTEQQYQEKDAVRRYQLDYDETICMVDKYPEAYHQEDVIQPPTIEEVEGSEREEEV